MNRSLSGSLPLFALVLGTLAGARQSRADEGMWTFHNPPRQLLKERYGIELTDDWLDRVRASSVRFNSGGSGSFVSAEGLVLTNHHVGLESIHKLSTRERDLVYDGFYARTRAEELRCPDLELNVVVGMTDVTARVKEAIADAADASDAAHKKRVAIGAIEGEARDQSGLRSNVVELYRGGEYWLYQYRQFTDVRLVFAPEERIGFFGGDLDNFTYPRFNLDFAVFRVYENDRPYQPPHYLRWNLDDMKEGDVVFVSGNPGRTERQQSVTQLLGLRDLSRPRSLRTVAHLVSSLRAYGEKGAEQARQAADMLAGLENTRKAYTGEYEGLLDDALMARKQAEEDALKTAIEERAALKSTVGDAFGDLERALEAEARFDQRRYYSRLRGDLADIALTLVRYADEIEKPSAERLAPFRDSSLDSLRLRLLSEAPVYKGLEETMLRASLELSKEHLAADDPFVVATGATRPAEAARRLVEGTTLLDVEARRKLLEGGRAAIEASDDPLIQVMRRVDPILREFQERSEAVDSALTDASGRIAQARFDILGNQVYPDATFTLRLAIGTVKGYEEDTTLVPWKTTFYGLYERANAFGFADPFSLPERYLSHESKVDLSTPLNFVHTADITGGNSGSPTLNAAGELVGLIFDGNIQSLPNNFVYADSADRAVSVHAAGIIEALESIYDAKPLARELLSR